MSFPQRSSMVSARAAASASSICLTGRAATPASSKSVSWEAAGTIRPALSAQPSGESASLSSRQSVHSRTTCVSIATYGLGAFSQPELEVDLGSFPTQAGAMLTFGIIERILAGHFTTEASSVRFGVDQDNLEQRNILRAPGRVVEGEALRLVLPGEPTNDSELPQA